MKTTTNTAHPLQVYFDKQRNLMWQRHCRDEIAEHRRKRRIAFGLELYDPEKEVWLTNQCFWQLFKKKS